MTRAFRLLFAVLLAVCPAGYLGGCGGTSTDAGNPELTISFRKGGEPSPFQGFIHVYADTASPGVYVPPPLDGAKSPADDRPQVALGGANVYPPLSKASTHTIEWGWIAHASDYRVLLPRLPGTADEDDFAIAAEKGSHDERTVQPFNMYFDALDGTSAFVQGLTYDPEANTFRDADGAAFDALEVELIPEADFSGTVDTAGLAGAPLVVFTPGSPIAAPVRGNRFRLKGLPLARFTARILTDDGVIHDVEGQMDATAGEPNRNDNTLAPLVPGRAVDTLKLPPPVRVLETPTASPPGPHIFTDSVVVTLSSPQDGTTLYYTLGGAKQPDNFANKYTGPIVLRGNTTLMAVAYRLGDNHSAVTIHSYTMVPPAPAANPASRAFRDSVIVALSTRAADGAILYTLDGSVPDTSSAIYSRPLVLKTTTVLKTRTRAAGLELSAVTEEHYTLIPDTLASP